MSETKTFTVYTSESTSIWSYANPIGLAANLWRQRKLIYHMTRRDVSQRYKSTILGLMWPIVLPLVMLAVYTFIFGIVFKARWGMTPSENHFQFAVTLFCGLVMYNVFSETLGSATNIIVSNPNYVRKVVFPLEILPVVSMAAAMFHAFLGFCIMLVGAVFSVGMPSWTILYFPLVLVTLCSLTLALAWFLAALGVFIRDISQWVTLLVQIMIYATPVFYPLDIVPEKYKWILLLNPLTQIVIDARRTILWHMPPDWGPWAVTTAVTLILMQLGYMVFMRSKGAFGDVV